MPALVLAAVLAGSPEPSPFVLMVEAGGGARGGETQPFYGTLRAGAGLRWEFLRLGLQGRALLGVPAFDVGAFLTADLVRVQLDDSLSVALFTGVDGLARFESGAQGGLVLGQLGVRGVGIYALFAAGGQWRPSVAPAFTAELRVGLELIEFFEFLSLP